MRRFLILITFLLIILPISPSSAYIDDEILEEDENYTQYRLDYITEFLIDDDYTIIDSRLKEIRDLYTITLDLEAGTYHAWVFGGYEIIDLGLFAYDENNIEVAADNNAPPPFDYDIYAELYGREDEIPEIHFTLPFAETLQFDIEVFEFINDRYEDYYYYYEHDPIEEFYERGYIGFILAKSPDTY